MVLKDANYLLKKKIPQLHAAPPLTRPPARDQRLQEVGSRVPWNRGSRGSVETQKLPLRLRL